MSPCRVVDRQDVWGETSYRVWLPTKNAVVRARASDLSVLGEIRPTVAQILHVAAAAKLQDALEENLLLAPIQSSVVPLPHQLYALNRAMSRDRIRYLLADEVGLGKTIEAGLILRELSGGSPRRARELSMRAERRVSKMLKQLFAAGAAIASSTLGVVYATWMIPLMGWPQFHIGMSVDSVDQLASTKPPSTARDWPVT